MYVAGVDERLAREEADLVAQIAAGDIEAPVAELYRRYAGRLYRCGLQALGDPGLAEETVQECFVRLWRTAGQFDPRRGTVAAYLIVLARSAAADVRKRPSSRPLVPLEETLAAAAARQRGADLDRAGGAGGGGLAEPGAPAGRCCWPRRGFPSPRSRPGSGCRWAR